MKRHRNHQIDELAQQVLRDAIPPTWVPNEQHKDYGKDYLVEIGEDNGELSGSSFYLQLKGQERADISANGTLVKYSLESKYARYYFDKIKDLPVFLVVVDVNRKKGWWLFLQPVLGADKSWKRKRSITVSLPAGNDITDTVSLRKAVEESKKWMRLHHPQSIHESVVAHKQRITGTDPRFDVKVSLVDDQPRFTLLAKEEVPLTFTFSGDHDKIGKKVSDLIDKGALVTFEPGEIKITGSKLFEPLEQSGGALQAAVDLNGTVTLICRNEEGSELARLSDVPGRFTGGRKELWFDGELVNSPLTLKLGPIASGVGGSVKFKINLHRWDGQCLMQLAFFDRLNAFFRALPQSVSTTVECQSDGNSIFSVNLPLQNHPIVLPLGDYLNTLCKARKIAHRFNVNPKWTVKVCDPNALDTTEQLYAILFENGWTGPTPNVRLNASCIRKTFNFDAANKANQPGLVTLTSDCSYTFFGGKVEVGRLVQSFTQMTVQVKKGKPQAKKAKATTRRKSNSRKSTNNDTQEIVLIGSRETILNIRLEEQTPSHQDLGQSVLSAQSKVIQLPSG